MKKWLVGLIFCCLAMPAMASENWSLVDTAGHAVRLSDFRGKWLMVNFWATWCPPCLAEIPGLNDLRRENIAVVGIAVSYADQKEVLDFIRQKNIAYPVVLGNEDVASLFGGIDSLPTSFLYSPEGKLVGQHQGPLTPEEVGRFIASRK